MAKKPKGSLTPKEVAEKSKKGWKAVAVPPSDVAPGDAPDAVAPELEELKKRYRMDVRDIKKQAKGPSEMHMVTVQPPEDTDTRAGHKVVLVEKGKKVGEQG
jgi:hypothetical protein